LGKLQGVVNFYECLKETLLVYAVRIFFAYWSVPSGEVKTITTKFTRVHEGRPMLACEEQDLKAHEIFAVCWEVQAKG